MTAKTPDWSGRRDDLAELRGILGPDMDAIAQQAARLMPAGVYVQPYMDECPSDVAFASACTEWQRAGVQGVLIHGSSTVLQHTYHAHARIVLDAGLRPYAAAGMNSDDMTGKAHRLGDILASDDCHGLVHDLEGKGEDEAAPAEWAQGMEYVRELVKRAGPFMRSKILLDQPWPVPTVHWSRFPYEPFAAICRAHAEQDYEEDWIRAYRHERHERCLVEFNRAWAVLDARLSAEGLKRARWHTIQGYGYADGMLDGLRYYLAKSRTMPIIVWSQWRPTEIVMREIRGVTATLPPPADPDATRKVASVA